MYVHVHAHKGHMYIDKREGGREKKSDIHTMIPYYLCLIYMYMYMYMYIYMFINKGEGEESNIYYLCLRIIGCCCSHSSCVTSMRKLSQSKAAKYPHGISIINIMIVFRCT